MPPRTSLLRGPLLVVVIFVLALLALYPGASLRAQCAWAAAAPFPRDGQADGDATDVFVEPMPREAEARPSGTPALRHSGTPARQPADDDQVRAPRARP